MEHAVRHKLSGRTYPCHEYDVILESESYVARINSQTLDIQPKEGGRYKLRRSFHSAA
jgi:hypothetical protein